MSYIIIALVLSAALGIWLFAASRDRQAASSKLRKSQADKRKIFKSHAAAAAELEPLRGQRRKRGFGQRG